MEMVIPWLKWAGSFAVILLLTAFAVREAIYWVFRVKMPFRDACILAFIMDVVNATSSAGPRRTAGGKYLATLPDSAGSCGMLLDISGSASCGKVPQANISPRPFMKKPPTHVISSYWLSPDGKQVTGPYSMPQILAMHKIMPMAPTTPMKLEGADYWATVADWLPSEPGSTSRRSSSSIQSRQGIPSWVFLAGLGLALAGVVFYFFVL